MLSGKRAGAIEDTGLPAPATTDLGKFPVQDARFRILCGDSDTAKFTYSCFAKMLLKRVSGEWADAQSRMALRYKKDFLPTKA